MTPHPFAAHMTPEAINALPMIGYEGPIRLIDSAEAAGTALLHLLEERLLGFDTETRAAFRKGESYPPSLVQLAAEDAVYIFQLGALGGLGGLERVLAQPTILKVGVAVARDVKELRATAPFEPAGFMDLANVTTKLGIRNNGLRGLAAAILGGRISKSAQCSNWALPRLSARQLRYAATDAWVCRRMYLRLAEEGLLPAPAA